MGFREQSVAANESDPSNPPSELLELRDEIDALDQDLLRLLSQRGALIQRVAKVKRTHRVPIRDRTREQEILRDRRARCDELGLSPGTVESLYRVLLTASRERQADLGAGVPDSLESRSVAIIGGRGGMGGMFRGLFESVGQEVLVADRETRLRPVEAAARAQVVVVSVPIDCTTEVIREIGPSCREDGLLCDLTSIKAEPVRAMLQHAPGDVIGTHPMFGPSVNTLQEQRIVLVPARLAPGSGWRGWLEGCLHARGLRVLESTAEEHDRSMGIVQVLTHLSTQALGLAMARLGVPISETLRFASPVYLVGLLMTARHFGQDPGLYGAIHRSNPEQPRVAEAMVSSLRDWLQAVEHRDQSRFDQLFAEAARFFGPFSDEALRESAHLIDRVVERG